MNDRHKTDGPVLLPSGREFEFWEKESAPSRVYFVDQNAAGASDGNDGSAARPFKTIGRAAEVLMPGEQVTVRAGIYRERVSPARGGESPEKMISYKAAEGETVVIKGSDLWSPVWIPTKYIHRDMTGIDSWQAELRGSQFEGANVFCLQNGRMDAQWGYNDEFELCRGMIFFGGRKLLQVSEYTQLNTFENFTGSFPGAFWMEENGMTVHLVLADGSDPNGKTFEITVREQVFAPKERYLNYIRVSGFRMFHAANPVPIPWPQKGLLSASAGHHWIIEDCEIGWSNTIGIDLGGQWWYYGKGEAQGYHIVRRCEIHHFGVCGIAGWHNMTNQGLLVEDNTLYECCTMHVPGHCENAAVKIHRTFDSLVRRNVITRTYYGSSIWLDGEIYNTRITQNVCLENYDCTWGQIFLEINEGPNMIDNNLLAVTRRFRWGKGEDQWDSAYGIYCHDAEKIIAVQNLVFDGEDCAIHFSKGNPGRTGRPFENDHRIWGNILSGYGKMIELPNGTSVSGKNVFAAYPGQLFYAFVSGYEGVLDYGAWKKKGFDANSSVIPMLLEIDKEKLTMRVTAAGIGELPEAEMPGELLPGLACGKDIFTYDITGRDRKGRFTAGPVADMPLDGSEFSIDPRRPR